MDVVTKSISIISSTKRTNELSMVRMDNHNSVQHLLRTTVMEDMKDTSSKGHQSDNVVAGILRIYLWSILWHSIKRITIDNRLCDWSIVLRRNVVAVLQISK